MQRVKVVDSVISIAPMMDWTDRHCRYFHRLLARDVWLYTEMVTAAAVHHGDANRFLRFDESEHPIALQLGGSNADWMASATAKASAYRYDEININVGCPSDRVQSGQFGACLMADPQLVAKCFRRMSDETDAPITVKTRIGIDDKDDDEFLQTFVATLADAGCKKFIVHARIAILNGLSPKENRTIPPLNYERVFRLKNAFPELTIVLNGGLTDVATIQEVMRHVDGVMIGREAYQNPYFLAELVHALDPAQSMPSRAEIVTEMARYIDVATQDGVPLRRITRHMMGLFAGQPGARAWRRYLSEGLNFDSAGADNVIDALNAMPGAAQAATIRTSI